jgi:hypothetical protein
MNDDWVVVRTFTTHIEADLASTALAAAGIDASIRADDCGGVYPFKGGVELLVASADAVIAEEVLSTVALGVDTETDTETVKD